MGCGRSKFASIYPRKSKNKNVSRKSLREDEEEWLPEHGGLGESPNSPEASASARRAAAIARARQLSSGPLLAQADVSSSQLDFFKMLDEKIENGPDYDASKTYTSPFSERSSTRPMPIPTASYVTYQNGEVRGKPGKPRTTSIIKHQFADSINNSSPPVNNHAILGPRRGHLSSRLPTVQASPPTNDSKLSSPFHHGKTTVFNMKHRTVL